MKQIKKLDPVTITKIAAGEIIDRPVSIIKELIENSIDAKSTSITVSLEHGGKTYIKITDNGHGISKNNLPLALEKHATSKISKLEDIYNHHDFGFRGEALSSIAHIASVTISSKTSSDDPFKIHSFQNNTSQPEPTQHPNGTTIEVNGIFDTIPVRKKFLKTETTELSYISSTIMHFSLFNPAINFILRNNDKEIINTSGINTQKERIMLFYGKDAFKSLIKIDQTIHNIRCNGYISNPTFTFASKSKQILSVNNRLVKSHLIQKAIQRGFKDIIPDKRFPLFIANISVPPDSIDINIHPQKQDIKFLNPGLIIDNLPRLIHLCINQSPPDLNYPNQSNQNLIQSNTQSTPNYSYASPTYSSTVTTTEVPSTTLFESNSTISNTDTIQENDNIEFLHLFDTYLAINQPNGLWLLDQHAVHERILYEKFKQKNPETIVTQPLLLSEIIELEPDLFLTFKKEKHYLDSINFITEEFGINQIVVREIPSIFHDTPINPLLLKILEQLKEFPGSTRDLTLEQKETLQMKACKAAIKAGKKMDPLEVNQLIKDFIKCPLNYTCPHGRPLYIHLTKSKLEHFFHRT
ncbi:DNA mismatch repair endonuclease MutL [Candidatus Marinamargulisbacteria bacterium SCGC AG-410-N11]|nr:DNA mismatch repair endonuclease MutL [Candidatus Marinamargulisbacteria bacterium SCGC AG-410-N11]